MRLGGGVGASPGPCRLCGRGRELVDVDEEQDDEQLDDLCLDLLSRLDPANVVEAFAWCWSCRVGTAQIARDTDAA